MSRLVDYSITGVIYHFEDGKLISFILITYSKLVISKIHKGLSNNAFRIFGITLLESRFDFDGDTVSLSQ